MASGHVTVIGGGLAGSEAAWQAARLGVDVTLFEMRPVRMTPAHTGSGLAELVCSNSLGGNSPDTPAGLLKEEMRLLGSLVIRMADAASVPAGGALAVDRDRFSAGITQAIQENDRIQVVRDEVTSIPESGIVILSTGPLTSDALAGKVRELTGQESLAFYDAAAPILAAESIDWTKGYWGSRYGKGGADYFNCPMTKEQYEAFYQALVSADVAESHLNDELTFFEGCMPIEEIARRGPRTLLFGPLRPVGLNDPKTGRRPYAVVQLRKENEAGTLLNLVGFQTRLKWGEQRRVFRMIPGLEQAEFARYGVIHRNTFLNSPRLLKPTYQMEKEPRLFFAGQITGVEGYVESAASGLVAGINAARMAAGLEPVGLPEQTMMGALAKYVTSADPEHFQPMNAAFGLLPPLPQPAREKAERRAQHSARALESMQRFLEHVSQGIPTR